MSETTTAQKWICESCGFIYDPADGDPDVIPVARVRTAGGGGFGNDQGMNAGGGGGGWLDAAPIGFIDAGPEGARFEAIPDPEAPVRMLKGGAAAVATIVT